jgi:hypothetical protein
MLELSVKTVTGWVLVCRSQGLEPFPCFCDLRLKGCCLVGRKFVEKVGERENYLAGIYLIEKTVSDKVIADERNLELDGHGFVDDSQMKLVEPSLVMYAGDNRER